MKDEARPKIGVNESSRTVSISGVFSDSDVYRLFEEMDENDWPEAANRALRLGAIAMRNARVAEQSDVVEREFARMQAEFRLTMDSYFSDNGTVVQTISKTFGDDGVMATKLNMFFGPDGRFERIVSEFVGDDGRLGKAIDAAIGDDGAFQRSLNDVFGDDGSLRRALDREFGEQGGRVFALLNPDDAKSPLGRFRAALESRLDPHKEGSALWQLRNDLQQQFQDVKVGLEIQDAEEIERQRGTRKGRDFEEVVFEAVNRISATHGDRAEHVGDDPGPIGDVGDIVVTIDFTAGGGLERALVIEAKNRSITFKGKNSIYKELDSAMQNRSSQLAIGVVEARHAGAFAPFRYAGPNHMLVAMDEEDEDPLALSLAIQFARVLVASRMAGKDVELDLQALQGHVQSIESQLETIQAMKTSLTGAETNIGAVRTALDALRKNVRESLDELGRSIQQAEVEQQKNDT